MLTLCPLCREIYRVDSELVGKSVKCCLCGSGFEVAFPTPCTPGEVVLTDFSIPTYSLFAYGCEALMRNLAKALRDVREPVDVGNMSEFLLNLPFDPNWDCYARKVLGAEGQSEAVRWYFCNEFRRIDASVREMMVSAVLGVLRGILRKEEECERPSSAS